MKSESKGTPIMAEVVDTLLRKAEQHDWAVCWRTADELAELGEPAIPRLILSLTHEDGYVRNAAAIALGKIGDPRAVDPLISAMRYKDDRAYDDDEDSEARMSAATALGEIADPKSLTPLIETLQDTLLSDTSLSWYIIDALGMLRDARAVPVLEKALGHSEPDVRKEAVKALDRIKGQNGQGRA